MDEPSNIFVITLGNPVDDLGQIHSIGVLPSSPFEVISSPDGEANDNQNFPRQTESDYNLSVTNQMTSPRSRVSDAVTCENAEDHETGDRLLSPVLRIQHQEKINTNEHRISTNELILQQFFDISYLNCTSPLSTSDDRKYLRLIRQGCFGILVTLSFFDSIVWMNYTYMKEGTKDFHRYTEMLFHVVNMLCKLYHVKVLMLLERKLTKVTRLLLRLEDCFNRLMPLIRQQPMELPGYKSLAVLFGVIPMIAAILWGTFGNYPIKEWNWEVVLYFGAMDVGRTFLDWRQGMLQAGNNKSEELLFANTPDAAWIALGSLRSAGKVASQMQRFAMCNLMLALAVSLFKHTKPLTKVFKLLGNKLSLRVINSNFEQDETHFEEAWKYYFRLRKVSVELNREFGGVIKCTHMTNILSLLVILLNIVLSQQTVVTVIVDLYEVMIMLIFYTLATNVNKVNELARKWIKDNTIPVSPIEVNTRTLHVLLDDIKQAPIGLGSGNSLVDGGFIQRVLGLLASLLAFMVEAETDTVQPA